MRMPRTVSAALSLSWRAGRAGVMARPDGLSRLDVFQDHKAEHDTGGRDGGDQGEPLLDEGPDGVAEAVEQEGEEEEAEAAGDHAGGDEDGEVEVGEAGGDRDDLVRDRGEAFDEDHPEAVLPEAIDEGVCC